MNSPAAYMPRFAMTHRFYATFLIFALCACVWAAPASAKPANRAVPKYASMVMDAATGEILHQRNQDTSVYPASLTKMMTLLMLFDAIEAGQMTLNTPMKVSKRAEAASPSKLGLKAGQTIRARDAMMGLVTKSANDASVVIAENLDGSESAFARKMTARARELGMTRTRFINASGLHHPSQVTTARDMLRLSAILIGQYPKYYSYFKTQNFNYKGRSYHNHNRLMSSYRGMDGLKTGYIRPSGFNLAASAKRDGRRVIAVVFGGRSATSRNAHMAQLLDAGFAKIAGRPVSMPSDPANDAIMADVAPAKSAKSKPTQKKLHVSAGTIPQSRAGTTVAANLEDLESLAIAPEDLEKAPGQIGATPKRGSFGHNVKQAALKKQGYQRIRVANTEAGQTGAILPQSREMVYEGAPNQATASTTPGGRGWSIQIGAYATREATESVLQQARSRLPENLSHAAATVSPVRNTDESWMYRARLTNLTQSEALRACGYFKDCLMIGSGS